ncbi:hypothetical protein BP5796_12418 [Coleophoma crateriformis]|uniref:Uncharacterized protein n=1 Tax=Coleophoma crateriformis TaxID=565419 RepID=A0A3D8QA48_9HELO|nr:hypothetical protein BP5796_12418 [Coleophoma crateriformis]
MPAEPSASTSFANPFVSVVEFIGYAGRAASASQEVNCWSLGPFIIQGIFILVPPALFAASIYIILGRIILLTEGESYSMIKRTRLTKTFVWGDVLCFWLQAGGGGLQAASASATLPKIGNYVVIAGLAFQIVWFGFFLIVATTFHRRMLRAPTERSQQPEVRWESYLTTLYVCSSLIMVRSVFRVIEYAMGNDGYLMAHEAFLYVFDSVPMFIVVVWLHWKHPSEIGLLLRGQEPRANGFEIVTMRRKEAEI